MSLNKDEVMRQALKRCPFCGGEALLVLCGFGTARVNCTGCDAEGPYCPSRQEAIAAWNRRTALEAGAPEASIAEQIAQQWDGCIYTDAPGGDIDIGEAIRTAWKRLASSPDPQANEGGGA